MRLLYDANVETGAPASRSSPWWAAELSSSQLFALYAPLLLPWGQEHILRSLSIPARLNTHSRFPLGTENLLAWSKSESLFSCLNPIAFSKVATRFSEHAGIERKSSPLHTCVTHKGWACKICSGSRSATIISEFLFRSYKAVIDLPIAMGLTNISLSVPTENVVWFRFKELIM